MGFTKPHTGKPESGWAGLREKVSEKHQLIHSTSAKKPWIQFIIKPVICAKIKNVDDFSIFFANPLTR